MDQDKITGLGFPPLEMVGSLRSIIHLFGTSKSRCGIYLLVLPNNRFYIGQAVDVVRRFAQHRLAHETIEAFSFIPTKRQQLDTKEKGLIFQAERTGLTLVNVVHVTDIAGETDLEVLVPLDLQERWLADPGSTSKFDLDTDRLRLPKAQRERFIKNFSDFVTHPLGESGAALLFQYLSAAVPFPRLTEYSFWSVSCMPSTNAQSWPRLLCVSAGVMETFCLGYFKQTEFTGCMWGFINVASDALFEACGGEEKFREQYPEVEVRKSKYRDAGQHQVSLFAWVQDDMLDLLLDNTVVRAAGLLLLRVMRKRGTIYSKFHCQQLVDRAFELQGASPEQLSNIIGS